MLPALDGTGARHHRDVASPHRYPTDVDDGVVGLEFAAHELERLEDGNGALDSGECFPRELLDSDAVAYRPDDGAGLATGYVCICADFSQPLDHGLEVALFGVGTEDDQQ